MGKWGLLIDIKNTEERYRTIVPMRARKGHDYQRFEEAIKKKRSLVVGQRKNIEELRVHTRIP